jgi:HSP20 family protein
MRIQRSARDPQLFELISSVLTIQCEVRKVEKKRKGLYPMLTRLDPLRGVASLRQAMDDLLEQSLVRHGWPETLPQMLPPMDVEETDQGYRVRLSIPGFNAEDLEVIAQQNTLTIRGQVGQEETERQRKRNLLRREIRTEAFERSIAFGRPIDPDKIAVSYENGILTLDIPASEEARARRIDIASLQQAKSMGTGQIEQGKQSEPTGQAGQIEQGKQSGQT